ncbi:MAG: signal peptidase I [Archangium sp.]|nr:signal peptidase I [Archangium sp.]
MATIGWFILGAFIAPGVTWWRAGRRGIAVIVASVSVSLPLFMFVALPRAPKLGLAAMLASVVLVGANFVLGIIAVVVLRRAKQLEPWSTTSIFLIAVLLAGMPARFLPKREFENFQMPSESMQPSLVKGDHFFALKDRQNHPLERGSVIVYFDQLRGLHYVKRVIGLPGDTVEQVGDRLSINGVELERRPCVDQPAPCSLEVFGERSWRILPGFRGAGSWTVPPDSLFVVGDNRDNSEDSRFNGPIASVDVVGVARVIHFSIPNVQRSGKSIDPEP